ncbi:DUF4244 domain-containing protein [Nesterenkonia sp. MY13]|uniref:DUF4244 domain-containing protein n=1 Tax=Nesterenkonia sedimenti TaxID=1463632 RepID=A0A7X8TLZ5_9MICC|nr:DUF4244 domain-containing protein [Nesterenkonia sedimenti]
MCLCVTVRVSRGTVAAVAFAGLLTAILTSDTVRGWLEALVQQALNP